MRSDINLVLRRESKRDKVVLGSFSGWERWAETQACNKSVREGTLKIEEQLIHFVTRQKLTHHCKAIILQ